jgi:hypothetical protein
MERDKVKKLNQQKMDEEADLVIIDSEQPIIKKKGFHIV